jgi:hypothetical protein
MRVPFAPHPHQHMLVVVVFVVVVILFIFYFNSLMFLLFIRAYNSWVISPPLPYSLPYHPPCPLTLLPTPSIPSRNYFALISNFVIERV